MFHLLPLDEPHSDELINKVASALDFNSPRASLLVLGGRQWFFGECLSTAVSADTFLYADSHEDSIKDAEDADIFATQLDSFSNYEAIGQLGKFDGVLMKDVFEVTEFDIGGLLETLWKILKLNSKAVLLFRPKPTFPAPQSLRCRWEENVPSVETLREHSKSEDAMFVVEDTPISYETTVSKQDLKQALKDFGCDDNDINAQINELNGENVSFKDEMILVTLTKVID